MRLGLLILILACLAFLGTPVCGCSARGGAYAAAMKSDLKNLASAQEIHLADHGRYSSTVESIELVPSDGVTVTIEWAGDRGWAARAVHSSLYGPYAGADCVAAVGSGGVIPATTLKGREPTDAAPIACDLDGWRVNQSRLDRLRWRIGE
jgi:hypothetical protein